VTTPAVKSFFCHCNMCRKATGGPFTVYALVDEGQIKFTGTGQLKAYQSSEECTRYFCKHCGSPLATHVVNAGQYKVPLARFTWHGNQIDRLVAPSAHEFYTDRVLDIPDALPKFKTSQEAGDLLGDTDLADKKRTAKTKSADRKRVVEQFKGSCLCGAVTIQTTCAPAGDSGHMCHCSACQSYTGTSCVAYGVFPDNAVSYAGSENLRAFQTTPGAMRYRCKTCSSLCRLHLPGRRLSQVPLALLSISPVLPGFHQYYTNRLMDMADESIKFEKEKGGKAFSSIIQNTDPVEAE